jgi:hypothetical protein
VSRRPTEGALVRVVVIAVDLPDGQRWADAQPVPPEQITVVTPRSPDRARGVAADAVLLTAAAERLPTAVLEELSAVTVPCCAGRQLTHPRPGITAGQRPESS